MEDLVAAGEAGRECDRHWCVGAQPLVRKWPFHHSAEVHLSKLWELVEDRRAWKAAVHGGHKESDTT